MNGAKATAVLSLLAVCLLAPLTVSADDAYEEYSFVDTKSNYTARLSGGNSVTLQLPLYDLVGWHADRWVKEGKLYYIIVDDDGKESQPIELLQWGNSGAAVDDDATKVPTYINVTDNGEFDITPGVGNPFILPNTSTGSKTKDFYTERRTNVGYWCIYVDWTVPKNIQGKKVKFRWDATIYVNGALNLEFDYVIFNFSTISDLIDLPEGSTPYNPTLSQPIISLDNVGKILVPWYITAQTVVNACAYYTDSNNEVHSIPLEANSNGYIPLPATERHKNVYVNVSYKDYYGYIFADRQSEKTDVPMLHAPLNFRATPVDDGKGSVLLEWEIGDNDFKDYYDNDFFEIQRSVTGKEEDYEALTVVLFDNEATHYSLKDSTLLSSLAGEVKNPKYRIRRMVTEIWGWKDNPTKAEAKASLFPMRLLTPSTPHAEWESEREHKVKVTWDYVTSDTYQNIWDNRAEIKIRVNMYNRSKELVETTETTLTNEDINKKEKVLSLTRSCVNYSIEMVCDPKSSPFDFSQGKETLEGIKIFTIDDWRALKELVATEESDRTKTVYLMADITLGPDDGIGTSDRSFTGMLDGRGHTINIKNAPPIHYAWNATILNLKIAGETDGSGDAGGLVHAGSFVTIENCIMEANFTNVIENSAFAYDMTTKVTITNSLFAGKVIQNSTNSKWYGFVPAIKRGNYNIQNCLSAIAEGSTLYDYYLNTGVFGVNFVYQSSTTPKINVSNNYYTGTNYFTSQSDNNGELIATEPTQLLAALGSGWTTSDEWPGVQPVTPGITREYVIITIPVSAAAPDTTFYFQSSGKVEKTLNVQKRQSSVLLTWNTDGGVIDYFQVLRRVKGSGNDLEVIAPNVETTSYEDKDVSPLLEYEYCVRSAVDCEGMTYQYTDTMTGACEHTGMVEGYVRYPDGTGAGGIQVDITRDNKVEQTVFTEEDGHFEAKGLSYHSGTSVSYSISPVSKTDLGLKPASQNADFNGEYNYYMLDAFVITTGVRFSGYVMYAGTSIPVKGARFLVNGKELRNTNGMPLESDFDGKVSFYVTKDEKTKIQAVMDGHTFTNDGYYKSSEGYEFKENVSQVYFYDETKVKLIGRIVGGDKQGDLPLDNNLSHNNLGIGVKMVLTLEGDNSSWLVYDNKNPEISTRDEVIPHKVNDANTYKTKVHITRKRMEVSPDSISGEYILYLPPVRWKVQQVYSYGYPTLFQEGMVSEVIDLTNSITEQADTIAGNFTTQGGQPITNPVVRYHAKYSRIYHAPVELLCRQVVYDDFDYFGDKNYISRSVGSKSVTVPLAWADSTGITHYTFGHPMFSLDRSYPVKLNAVERYYWNNNRDNDTIDVVKVGGGKVTIQNGLVSGTHKDIVKLDDNGEAYYSIKAKQATYLLQGKDALRTVTITLEQDGTTYEAERIQGYVFNIFSTPGTKDLLNVGAPMLFDILRDPPGGGSSATLHKGSTLTNSYSVDMSIAFKGNISIATGTSLTSFTGTVLESGLTWGLVDSSDHSTMFDQTFGLDYEGNRSFSYTMNVNEDISTSSDPTMTGADADLYIGGVNNIVVTPAYTIRAIPDSTFQHFKAMTTGATLPTGEVAQYTPMTVIASGTDANNNLYHLVSDQSLSYGSTVSSRFVYSQKYILEQLIPSLVEQCRSLMFIGTAAEAQTRANATGMPVYRSLLEPTDSLFGIANTKYGEFYYNAGDNAQTSGMSYVIHLPSTNNKEFPDMVQQHWQSVLSWLNMISLNEREKLSVRDDELLKNYNLDGGSKVSYSESFSSDYSTSNYMALPLVKTASFSDFWLGLGYTGTSYVFMPLVAKLFEKLSKYTSKDNIQEDGLKSRDGDNNTIEQKVNFSGSSFSFKLIPIFNYSTKGVGKEEKSYNRSESFNIDLNSKSHIDFDIYRVQTHTETPSTISVNDVYTSQNLEDIINLSEGYISREYNTNYWTYPRGFIYRTRGGATARPWERGYKSLIYNPGAVIDERTKQIENPKIQLDKQSVSGVAYGEPARFKVYLTNESEEPEAATGPLAFYNFYLDETTNPNGAHLFVDGTPLNGSGRSIRLTPGEVTQKTLEVYAGEDFDYEGIVLGVMSQGDFSIGDEVAFDVHFLRQAGGVEISSPGDKWVMNTDAQYNEERGYFIPVVISGFDKHQKNFDHIEFQYKETARGDDYWTNLCSYYADSTLMAKANGVADMIPANGNITTKFYGEGVEMEQAYDLRAVLFCRDGNNLLTTSSKVLSGVKDTRRPRLFGTPEPTDGVLDIGESIVFNFSEDIEYNYLRETTHFEVKGEVNNDNINETVSVLFNGNSSMETEARRNFNNKDVTIDMLIKPDYTGEDMPLFSHGQGGKKLQLWITKDSLLKAVVNDLEFVSDSVIDCSAFTLVAMVIKQPDLEKGDSFCHLNFYNGGVNIGSFDFKEPYTGTGRLIFGRTNEAVYSNSKFYKGRMKEAKVWYRALDGKLLGNTYGYKRLTGYEMGLVDYYPMDEGSGSYALDKAQGANATLNNTSWAMPKGMSLHLEWEDRGMELTPQALSRTADEDYTLMFWFKTDANGHGALISNGGGHAEDNGAANQFYIGFEGEQLVYRTNGMQVDIPGNFSDNAWHHYAMTVNRNHNIVNIYVDKTLLATFKADSIAGISGGHMLLGGSVYERVENGVTRTIDSGNWLRGNLDEICLFEQALPLYLISNYSTKAPHGDEAGLKTYLAFDRQERQGDNDITFVPYAYSKKIYKDKEGNIIYQKDQETNADTSTPQRDYRFVDDEETVLAHVDKTDAAPVVPDEDLHNLDFDFTGRGNQLLVSINELQTRINRRHVYVTLREIPDKNGNNMASPVTACFYVDRSPLKWFISHETITKPYGEEEVLYLTIENTSSVSHTYTIENLPKWITVNEISGIIGPKDNATIKGTISNGLNVGSYDEVIYLRDEDGFAEPFYLTVVVEGEEPQWAVNRELGEYTMNIAGRVLINGEIDTDSRDIVGVFDKEGTCHGVAHIDYDNTSYDNLVYLTIYDKKNDGKNLYFKLWNYATGLEMIMQPDTIKFHASATLGLDKPIVFTAGTIFVQNLNLKKGWNWVSFFVYDDKSFSNANGLLKAFPWQHGDILMDNTAEKTLNYKNGNWLCSNNSKMITIMPKRSYWVYVQNDVKVALAGSLIEEKTQRTIRVTEGWNHIGYTPMKNLSIETALGDYYDFASEGDVIKSHNEFAYFSKYNNIGRWQGNLKYMKPGEGYMLLRKAKTDASFTYPFIEPGSTFIDEWAKAPERTHSTEGNHQSTMSLTAIATGVDMEPGDHLLAYTDGELRGVGVLGADSIFYMSIEGDSRQPLWFAIERDDDIIATTAEIATFEGNAVMGTPATPTCIDFTKRDIPKYGWYTLDGVRLQGRPMKKGIYIYNGKKRVITD